MRSKRLISMIVSAGALGAIAGCGAPADPADPAGESTEALKALSTMAQRTFVYTPDTYSGLDFGAPSAYTPIVGDFDNDGFTDYARLSNSGAYIFYGDLGGQFTYNTFYTYKGLDFGLPSAWQTITGDFNGDHRTDYMQLGDTGAFIFYGTEYRTFEGNGTEANAFQSYNGLSFGLPSAWRPVTGDFNGDGLTDYLRVGSSGAWVFMNGKNGFTQSFQTFGWDGAADDQLISGDFNGDGYADYGLLGGTVSVYYYGGSNGFTYQYQTYPGLDFGAPSQWKVVTGDFNGDHRTDYARVGDTGAFVYYGNPIADFTGSFQSYGGLHFGIPTTWQTISGDFDGDGRGDYGLLGGTDAYIFYGTTTLGTFDAKRQAYPGGLNYGNPSTWQVLSGNFNGDNKGDYVRLGGPFADTYLGH